MKKTLQLFVPVDLPVEVSYIDGKSGPVVVSLNVVHPQDKIRRVPVDLLPLETVTAIAEKVSVALQAGATAHANDPQAG